jgi:hypothetical protein
MQLGFLIVLVGAVLAATLLLVLLAVFARR